MPAEKGREPKSAERPKGLTTQKELAAFIKRSARQVHNLTEKGVFARVVHPDDPGRIYYDLAASVQSWIAYQVGLETAAAKETDEDEAERRKAVADAELKEMKVAQLRGSLITVEQHRREMQRVLRRVRESIDTFPGKHAAKLPGDASMNDRVKALRKVALELMAELRTAADVTDDDDDEEDAAA